MYFDAHFIFNTFRSRGVFMFVLCLMILCSVRPSFAAEAEATLQAETTDDSAIEAAGIVSEHGQLSVSSSGFVVDKNQSVFQIQGISTHNLAWYPEYVHFANFVMSSISTQSALPCTQQKMAAIASAMTLQDSKCLPV